MKNLRKVLVATDLSDTSRRGLLYACSLADKEKASLLVLHVANEFAAWEYYSEEFGFINGSAQLWPSDRVLAEATLDLNRFLERHLETLRPIPLVTKRVTLGPVAQRIAEVAATEQADLIVLSPGRRYALRHLFGGCITARVTRMSPCPVLAVTSPLPPRLWRGRWLPDWLGWLRPSTANV
jgi:nucleotide-binding universal stress UspA family protein